jgi:coenzyme PQQ synthesis protein D (PqqD)
MGDDRMSETRYVARSPQVAARRLGDEMMVMSAADSTLFTLSEVAAAIWEAADGVTPLEEIVSRKVCSEFDVDPQTALRDAQALVEALAGHQILLLSDRPFQPAHSEQA